MSQQNDESQVMTVGLLKRFLSIYHDDLPVTAQVPGGEVLAIRYASTLVMNPGNVLVFALNTTKDINGRKTEAVIVKP